MRWASRYCEFLFRISTKSEKTIRICRIREFAELKGVNKRLLIYRLQKASLQNPRFELKVKAK
jgi:hypothetical protein